MVNQEAKDCGCQDGCCEPKKKNKLWMQIVFALIFLTALSIITVKLVGRGDDKTILGKDSTCTKTSGCCPGSGQKSCAKTSDSTNKTSCCPKEKK